MPRLDDALVEVQRFAEHPPVDVPPVGVLETRSRRRRTRRRAAGTAVALLTVVATGFGIGIAANDNATDDVHVTGTGPRPVTAPAAALDATARPATGLDDGDQVSVEFAAPPVPGLAAQCAADALAPDVEDTDWCDLNVRPMEEAVGSTLRFAVSRVIETSSGLVDCAEAPRRCVLGARRTSSDSSVMWAAISFRSDLPPIPEPIVTLDRVDLSDGDVIDIRGEGYRPGAEVFLSQCVATDRCDQAMGAHLTAAGDGTFGADFRVSSEILTYDGWQRCSPCALHASAFRTAPESVSISVAERAGDAARPMVRIMEPGPYQPEQRVTLEGSGFQMGATDMSIGWCYLPLTPDGYSRCAYPSSGFVRADDHGNVTINDYRMPPADYGCWEPGQCALQWLPGEAVPSPFSTPFEMIGP
jgi:hypothetical protein